MKPERKCNECGHPISSPYVVTAHDFEVREDGRLVLVMEWVYARSLALPLLGAGTAGLPREVCLDTMFQFLAGNLLRGLAPLQDVRIVLASP